jgi:hypothetical protein
MLKARVVEREEAAITRQRLVKHAPAATATHAAMEILLDVVFSMRSSPMLCNQDKRDKEGQLMSARSSHPQEKGSDSHTPSPVEEEAPLLNTYTSRREQKSWSWIPSRLNTKNSFAGEDQQQFNRPTDRLTDWQKPVSCRHRLVERQPIASKDVSMEAEKYVCLRAVPRQRLVKL